MFAMVSSPVFNPFVLLMDPASVLRAVEASPALCQLNARVFRPLGPLEQGCGEPDEEADAGGRRADEAADQQD